MTAMQNPRPLHRSSDRSLRLAGVRRDRSAFTLTELLIVIALIALLVGILLTALGAVRKKALGTSTLATIQAFANACDAFHQEHGFHPGIVPEDVLAADPRISGTENALLHLMGGFIRAADVDSGTYGNWDDGIMPDPVEITFNGPSGQYRVKIDRSRIGEGPVIGGKPYPPYFTPGARDIGVAEGQVNPATDIPDLLDAWGQPVLYLRRTRPFGLLTSPDPSDQPQFDMAPLTPYTGSTALGRLGRNQVFDSGGNPAGSILTTTDATLNFARIIGHPALEGQARGAFVLISAGADGVYMSATDGPGEAATPIESLLDQPIDVVDEYDDIVTFGGS